MHKRATLFKFLIPSLIGVFMFLFPMKNADGDTTIPVAYLADALNELIGYDNVVLIVVILINISALLTSSSAGWSILVTNSSGTCSG